MKVVSANHYGYVHDSSFVATTSWLNQASCCLRIMSNHTCPTHKKSTQQSSEQRIYVTITLSLTWCQWLTFSMRSHSSKSFWFWLIISMKQRIVSWVPWKNVVGYWREIMGKIIVNPVCVTSISNWPKVLPWQLTYTGTFLFTPIYCPIQNLFVHNIA